MVSLLWAPAGDPGAWAAQVARCPTVPLPALKPLSSPLLSSLRNPFASVQLKPTVTNDRSAPLLS